MRIVPWDQNVLVFWEEDIDGSGEVYQVARSTDGGASYADPVGIGVAAGDEAAELTWTVDGDDLVVAWRDQRFSTPEIFVSRSSDAGATWSDHVLASENDGVPSERPRLMHGTRTVSYTHLTLPTMCVV